MQSAFIKISNLPDKAFEVMVIKIPDLRRQWMNLVKTPTKR